MNMGMNEIISLEKDNYWPVFSRYPICFVRGEGVYLYDIDGKEYLDFLTGIGVVPLGHANPEVASAINEQSGKLLSCSNLFYNVPQVELVKKLNSLIELKGKWFLTNSGTEAVEAILKAARRYGFETKKSKIAYLKDSFHGRTFGAMSATGQDKIRKGFGELLSDFVEIDPENTAALDDFLTDDTAAVIIEIIQGESGVKPLSKEFLLKAYEISKKREILFLVDEVQTGLGRTGEKFFAFQKLGIEPDGVAIAKGLANGIPIGAAWISDELAELFHPGDHGSTYGGNAFASAVGLKVLEIIERERLTEKNSKNGAYFMHNLKELLHNIHIVKEVRGEGLMVAVELDGAVPDLIIRKLFERGIIAGKGGSSALRFLPPFTAEERHFDEVAKKVSEVLREL